HQTPPITTVSANPTITTPPPHQHLNITTPSSQHALITTTTPKRQQTVSNRRAIDRNRGRKTETTTLKAPAQPTETPR
ncbi:hypothetical protein A2U01_0058359, partial [Trifolium medium]|nr:hypothetical protein [Trifolium medium]